MAELRHIRKQFEIVAQNAPQLELRLHWFKGALRARDGYIVAVLRRQDPRGHQVASIAYEMPPPRYPNADHSAGDEPGHHLR